MKGKRTVTDLRKALREQSHDTEAFRNHLKAEDSTQVNLPPRNIPDRMVELEKSLAYQAQVVSELMERLLSYRVQSDKPPAGMDTALAPGQQCVIASDLNGFRMRIDENTTALQSLLRELDL